MARYAAKSQSITICPAALMAFSWLVVIMGDDLPASTISAAPALLPDVAPPTSAPPALSPDIYPIFPTPGGAVLAPSDSSAPLIPSSPSPPNPDELAAPAPESALSPEGVLPESSADGRRVEVLLSAAAAVAAFWVNGGLW